MNNYVKGARSNNVTMREVAATVFRKVGDDLYEVTKTREGDVVIGGLYSKTFVKVYAKVKADVYIE